VAPAERQPALDRQLRLLARAVERRLEDEDDRRAALVADARKHRLGRRRRSPLGKVGRFAVPVARRPG
jgi:hypothetical protein